jgi:hypothetical protein
MRILNTTPSQYAEVRELVVFAKEHHMSVFELVVLAKGCLGIDVSSPPWLRQITKWWLEI